MVGGQRVCYIIRNGPKIHPVECKHGLSRLVSQIFLFLADYLSFRLYFIKGDFRLNERRCFHCRCSYVTSRRGGTEISTRLFVPDVASDCKYVSILGKKFLRKGKEQYFITRVGWFRLEFNIS